MKMLRSLQCFAAMTVFLGLASASAAAQDTGHVKVQDDFSSGSLSHLDMPFPADWQILSEGDLHYLHMLRLQPPGVPRRPVQFARLKGVSVGSFTLNLKIRREHGSMIVVFGYVDTLHFYYAHLSKDPGAKVAVHNGSSSSMAENADESPGSRPNPHCRTFPGTMCASHEIGLRLHPDLRRPNRHSLCFPLSTGTFLCGQIGLGSFDETGAFLISACRARARNATRPRPSNDRRDRRDPWPSSAWIPQAVAIRRPITPRTTGEPSVLTDGFQVSPADAHCNPLAS